MNPRPLLIATLTIGSALWGATLAIKMHPRGASVLVEQLQQSSVQSPVAQSASQPLSTTSAPIAANPVLEEVVASAPDEFEQIRIQLRRAIRDRNLVLLRSLLQAGSVREALRSVGAAESMNFENFDHSTWTVLEKALNYHCRQSNEDIEPGSCFERQSPQPLP
jgi:hypothetical protein